MIEKREQCIEGNQLNTYLYSAHSAAILRDGNSRALHGRMSKLLELSPKLAIIIV